MRSSLAIICGAAQQTPRIFCGAAHQFACRNASIILLQCVNYFVAMRQLFCCNAAFLPTKSTFCGLPHTSTTFFVKIKLAKEILTHTTHKAFK